MFLLLLHLAVAQNAASVFGEVPTLELCFAFGQYHPVARFHRRCIAGTFFLLLHLGVEALFVNCETLLAANELREVEGEAIGVEQCEGFLTIYHGASGCFGLGNHAFE